MKKILILADFTKPETQLTTLATVYSRELSKLGYDISTRCIHNSVPPVGDIKCNVCLNFSDKPAFSASGIKDDYEYYDMVISPNYQFGVRRYYNDNFSGAYIINVPEYIIDDTVCKTSVPLKIKDLQGNYVFYTINRCYDYSTTAKLIQTFMEFYHTKSYYNASLVICTDRPIDNEILNIKKMLDIYDNIDNYAKPIVIHGSLTDEQRFGIHNACHAFIKTDLKTNYLNNELYSISKFICPMHVNAMCDAVKNETTLDVSVESYKLYSVQHHLNLLKGVI
jgi:hypothetical protein